MSHTHTGKYRVHDCSIYLALGLLLLAAPCAMHAQDSSRSLTGVVTDAGQEPLAGAVVELHDDDTKALISYITNRSGHYIFPRLSAQDDYHVRAKFRGHESRSRSLSKFDAKPKRNIKLVIKLY